MRDVWDDQANPAFAELLRRLVNIAEAGHIDAAEFAAEIMALHGPVHDAASAFKWYSRVPSLVLLDQAQVPPTLITALSSLIRYCRESYEGQE